MIVQLRNGESQKAYEAFVTYRDMGVQRSLAKVAEKLGKSSQIISRWSAKHAWGERVAEWDAQQFQKADNKREKMREKLIEDELADYEKQLDKWREVYEETRKFVRKGRVQAENMTIETIALEVAEWERLSKWRSEISRQGRLAMGLPDKIQEQHNTGKDGGAIEFKLTFSSHAEND